MLNRSGLPMLGVLLAIALTVSQAADPGGVAHAADGVAPSLAKNEVAFRRTSPIFMGGAATEHDGIETGARVRVTAICPDLAGKYTCTQDLTGEVFPMIVSQRINRRGATVYKQEFEENDPAPLFRVADGRVRTEKHAFPDGATDISSDFHACAENALFIHGVTSSETPPDSVLSLSGDAKVQKREDGVLVWDTTLIAYDNNQVTRSPQQLLCVPMP